jgi:hypothetical protein
MGKDQSGPAATAAEARIACGKRISTTERHGTVQYRLPTDAWAAGGGRLRKRALIDIYASDDRMRAPLM